MTQHNHISDYRLEQYVAGALDAATMRDIDRRLLEDAELQARVEAIKASNEEILAAMPPERAVADIKRKLRQAEGAEQKEQGRAWFVLPAMATAAAALIAVVVFMNLQQPLDTQSQNTGVTGIITKGDASLTIYRKNGAQSTALKSGAQAKKGDELQISYTAAGMAYGMIASVDGNGSVTLHLPDRAGAAATLKSGVNLLPFAYQLDDAPDYELFVFVTSSSTFDTVAVTAALKGLNEGKQGPGADLHLPESLHVYRMLLKK